MHTSFFDPLKSYYDNIEEGPFGLFADGEVHVDEGEPTYVFCGKKVHTPIGIPAGPLVNGAFVKAALDKGFTLPVHKTVRTHYLESHPFPNVLPVDVQGDLTLEKADQGLTTKDDYTDPLSITNSFGNPSFEPDRWQPELAEAVGHAREGQLVGGSFEGRKWEGYSDADYLQDWIDGALLLKETGVGFVEANYSCPNEGTTALLCYDIPKVLQISSKIKDAIGDLPLFLKTSFFKDDAELEKLVDAVGNIVDGFATINTISAEVRNKDGEQALPGEGRLRSGVCGNTIKWAGVDMTRRLTALREEKSMSFSVIGVGGVTKPEDYGGYIDAGADAVMSATGAMWNPMLAVEIKAS